METALRLLSPSHTYSAEGMYTINLTANNLSCPNLTEKIAAAYFIESPAPGVRYPAIKAVVEQTHNHKCEGIWRKIFMAAFHRP
jgi:hypothetical protein